MPIRVIGFDTAAGEFADDTRTVVINRTGARIILNRRVATNDSLRLVNLENYNEAEFRVVGPTAWAGGEINEWGVECTEPDRNIWGIEFSPPLAAAPGALIMCWTCHKEAFCALTPMELEVLDTSGSIERHCEQCGKPVSWTYADVTRRPRELPPLEAPPPPPRPAEGEKEAEKRRDKRLGMKLPVRVRGPRGVEEIAKTENVSKNGFAVLLSMELAVGNVVKAVCPYTPEGQNIEQKAEVRRRAPFSFGGRRLYGFAYVR